MNLDLQRILVGISLGADVTTELEVTDLDRRAFENALWLAKQVGAKLRLHHSIDWLGMAAVAAAPDLVSAATEQALGRLGALVEEAAHEGVPAEPTVGFGPPRGELLRVAESWRADCVVVGPRAHSQDLIGRMTYGSTARALARQSPCSVWVVAPQSHVGFKRPLFLVDLSPVSEELVELGEWMLARLGAELELLHCVDFPADIALRRFPNDRQAIKGHHTEILKAARVRVLALLGDAASSWCWSIKDDWIVRVGPKLAEEHESDLLVIAGTSKPGLAGKFLGSTAAKVIGRSSVSTLVVKPQRR
ncbi:MAG: nucleotide-binding universal stress UspA family protein [Bradymonadia bacterium]|jgi:nucleotide-binding universal stress UspA family protein